MRPVFPVGRRFVSLSAFCWMLLVCGLSQPDRLVWFCWIGLGWVSPQAPYSAALLMLYFCIFFLFLPRFGGERILRAAATKTYFYSHDPAGGLRNRGTYPTRVRVKHV